MVQPEIPRHVALRACASTIHVLRVPQADAPEFWECVDALYRVISACAATFQQVSNNLPGFPLPEEAATQFGMAAAYLERAGDRLALAWIAGVLGRPVQVAGTPDFLAPREGPLQALSDRAKKAA